MSFRPVSGDSGKARLVRAANSTTFTKGNALIDNASGFLTNAAVGENTDILYVAAETVTTTVEGQEINCWSTEGVEFEADADAAIANTDVGHAVDLASVSTIDPDASTDGVFWLERIMGAAGTSTVGRGRFTRGAVNS